MGVCSRAPPSPGPPPPPCRLQGASNGGSPGISLDARARHWASYCACVCLWVRARAQMWVCVQMCVRARLRLAVCELPCRYVYVSVCEMCVHACVQLSVCQRKAVCARVPARRRRGPAGRQRAELCRWVNVLGDARRGGPSAGAQPEAAGPGARGAGAGRTRRGAGPGTRPRW